MLRSYGWAIGIAVIAALLIRTFVIEAYRIPTMAMRPTLLPGDTLFVAKWPYQLSSPMPQRGEIVLFTPAGEEQRAYLKRVIGLPGDTVELKAGRPYLNGKPLPAQPSPELGPDCARERLPEGREYGSCREAPYLETKGPQRVPEGSIFVLGDLRSDAGKAQGWGNFPLSSIKGRALWIWLSVEPGTAGSSPRLRTRRMFRRIE